MRAHESLMQQQQLLQQQLFLQHRTDSAVAAVGVEAHVNSKASAGASSNKVTWQEQQQHQKNGAGKYELIYLFLIDLLLF